jgi:hypothetical protein
MHYQRTIIVVKITEQLNDLAIFFMCTSAWQKQNSRKSIQSRDMTSWGPIIVATGGPKMNRVISTYGRGAHRRYLCTTKTAFGLSNMDIDMHSVRRACRVVFPNVYWLVFDCRRTFVYASWPCPTGSRWPFQHSCPCMPMSRSRRTCIFASVACHLNAPPPP